MKTLSKYMEEAELAIPQDANTRERKVKIKASKDFLHANLSNLLNTDIKTAVSILVGKRGRKNDWMDTIIENLISKGSVDEVFIFKIYKKGRHEMKNVIKYALIKGVSIELVDGEYLVKDIQNV